MEAADVKQILLDNLDLAECQVKQDGTHYHIIAVADLFADLSRIKQQQAVMRPLQSFITDGQLHAVTIKTYTPQQWEKDKKLMALG